MNLKKLMVPLALCLILLTGCTGENGAARATREVQKDLLVSDAVLSTTAERAFVTVMEAEEKALSTQGEAQTKKAILFGALGQVAAKPLIKAYQEAWAAGQLGITLTVKNISGVKVIEKTTTQGVVVLKVDGTVNDESGSQKASDYYKITLVKQDDKWLLADIVLVFPAE